MGLEEGTDAAGNTPKTHDLTPADPAVEVQQILGIEAIPGERGDNSPRSGETTWYRDANLPIPGTPYQKDYYHTCSNVTHRRPAGFPGSFIDVTRSHEASDPNLNRVNFRITVRREPTGERVFFSLNSKSEREPWKYWTFTVDQGGMRDPRYGDYNFEAPQRYPDGKPTTPEQKTLFLTDIENNLGLVAGSLQDLDLAKAKEIAKAAAEADLPRTANEVAPPLLRTPQTPLKTT